MTIINVVKIYNPAGVLQKTISQKALLKRSDKIFLDPYLFCKDKRGRPKKASPQ
jgi:hypothetical protein